jgi:hypothetical protein
MTSIDLQDSEYRALVRLCQKYLVESAPAAAALEDRWLREERDIARRIVSCA